ncbi:DUF4145 domain-containing protein [Bradyrhizobium sp. WSM1743]|uniref:DUF4145 domain-containing protein n=1 Tax=Bradyrhizobium sp. WSM1743 TaxID=318996 RepID=UPI000482161D
MVDLNREKYDAIFKVDGPAGSLRNKIDLFFALGLCNESHHKVLHQIREIRNKFAHRIESLTFDDETIGPLVDKLGPETQTSTSRRLRFTNTIGTIMMLMYAVSTADIKLKGLGETHPRIYIELLKMTLPGSADEIEKIWQEHMGDQ